MQIIRATGLDRKSGGSALRYSVESREAGAHNTGSKPSMPCHDLIMHLKAVNPLVICLLLAGSALAQSSLSKQQQIELHVRQAAEFLKDKRPDQAIGEFNAILALDPDNVDAQGNLGVLLFFHDDYALATPHLRAAVKLQPGLAKIQALLGMCEKRTGDAAGAESDLKEAFPNLQEEKLKVRTGLELIEIYDAAGDYEKAAGVVGELRQLEPRDPAILYTAYRIYSTMTDEATLSLAMDAPGSAQMRQLQAHELTRQGNNDGAIAQYREALKIDPHLPGIHFELAEMLSQSGDADGAEKEYMAALAENPFDEKSECRLGEAALRVPDLKAASEHFSRALELQPEDIDAYVGQAKVAMALSQPEKALPLLERASKAEPFDAVVHYHLAMVYRSLGREADSGRELAEFQKLKDMKEKLRQTYRDMRLQPKNDRPDPSLPK
jgi:tetratricopeptide (TPR) repeat protein